LLLFLTNLLKLYSNVVIVGASKASNEGENL
jgi:hypothetical protein